MAALHLIQPRHPYGRRPYLPNGILNLGTRIAHATRDTIAFTDLNVDETLPASVSEADVIGISVLGTPYIPEAHAIIRRLRERKLEQPVVIGGQGVMRLSEEQFNRIYRKYGDVRRGVTEQELLQAFGLPFIDNAFDVSMGSMLTRLPQRYLEAYFTQEWCLFTSDGCVYNCNFCAASKGMRERFRAPAVIAEEMRAICGALSRLGCTSTDVYLSSLDIAQNVQQMEQALRTAARITSEYGITLRMRGLATSKCVVKAVAHDPDLLPRWRELGVHCIGIGVDGTAQAWATENKRHNSQVEIDSALTAISAAGITPEALMVIGFDGQPLGAVIDAVRASFTYMSRPQGIVVRPYLGKHGAPGSDSWATNSGLVDRLLSNPERFRHLEYAMLGSDETHPDRWQRQATNAMYFGTVMALKLTRRGCPTQPLLPTETSSLTLNTIGQAWNRLMPGDR